MELVLAKLLGILLGALFALLLGLTRRPSPVVEPEREAEAGDYVFQVSSDGVTPGRRAVRFPLDTPLGNGEN